MEEAIKILELLKTQDGELVVIGLLRLRLREAEENAVKREKAMRNTLNSPKFWKKEITV